MYQPKVISAHAEMLLTSAGPTTEAIQDRFVDLAHATGETKPHVVRLADGWMPFSAVADVSVVQKLQHRAEAVGSNMWSNKYIRYLLGNVTVSTICAANQDSESFEQLLRSTDLLVVPGANTYQTMNGISEHSNQICESVRAGLAYYGESAGSIVAGISLRPAAIAPADFNPYAGGGKGGEGLGLIGADIIVHAPGRHQQFAVPGIITRLTETALHWNESSDDDIHQAIEATKDTGIAHTYALRDDEALSISDGIVTRL